MYEWFAIIDVIVSLDNLLVAKGMIFKY